MSGYPGPGAATGPVVHRPGGVCPAPPDREVAVVLGAGDIGSAVACALFLVGWDVIVLDRPCPAWHRRGMSYTDAAYGQAVTLDGVWGVPARGAADGTRIAAARAGVAVTAACDIEGLLARIDVTLILDARMRKRQQPAALRSLGPPSIGIGPTFVAGEHVDAVIESEWGEDLGTPLWSGSAQPLRGEPRPIMGVGRERFVYAPCEGVFRGLFGVGETVEAGSLIGFVDGVTVAAPLSGVVRGISHDGALLHCGVKMFEVDPRGDPGRCFGVAERPRRIAQGVLQAAALRPLVVCA